MEFAKDEACSSEYSDDKESEVNLNILEEHFEELNVDPVGFWGFNFANFVFRIVQFTKPVSESSV